MGSGVVLGLCILFKVFDKDLVNLLLTLYFALIDAYVLIDAFIPSTGALATVQRQLQDVHAQLERAVLRGLVFGTDMVTVATSVDALIKLIFPREFATDTEKQKNSILGLGDIVIPGIFVVMLLRYDAHRANLVPAFLGSALITAFVRGESKELLEYSEEEEEEEKSDSVKDKDDDDQEETKKSK
uniref:Minor histocompatibility antigen H13 n=1 Tax=Peronospora matthiolae TaxID=2874970 RepID=A0AAV1T473_9STRA